MEADSEPASIVLQLLLIISLIFLNGFFTLAKTAILSLKKNQIKLLGEKGNRRAQLLEKLIDEPTEFLLTIQVGITCTLLISSAFIAIEIVKSFAVFLDGIGIPYGEKISFAIIMIIICYITLVFGEMYPKQVALKKAEAIAMFIAAPILFLSKLIMPFIKLVSGTTNFLVRLTGIDKVKSEDTISKEEIKSLIEVGQENGIINETEKEMINGIFKFDDKLAEEVMTPRTEVYMIDIDTPLTEYLDQLLEDKYSRIPVYEGDNDNIIGVLYIKDFILEARKHGFENVNIRNILHVPYFVLQSKNINELFKDLKSAKNHMAILIDEYGGFSGIVTIEDLIEEVMGNIYDEYDEDELSINKIDNNTFLVNGLLPVDELNEQLNLNLDTDSEDYDTVNGFLINQMGRIPKDSEEKIIRYENIIFKIEEIKEKRIEKVKVCIQRGV